MEILAAYSSRPSEKVEQFYHTGAPSRLPDEILIGCPVFFEHGIRKDGVPAAKEGGDQ